MPAVKSTKSTTTTLRKGWAFTINNPEDGDWPTWDENTMEYLVYQLEEGEEGTPHLQGYVHLAKKKRFLQVKALLGRKAHIEPAKGTPKQNKHYCSKPVDGCTCKHCKDAVRLDATEEFGLLPRINNKGLMECMVEFVDKGLSFYQACRAEPRLCDKKKAWDAFHGAHLEHKFKKWRDVEVDVLYGPAGCGKTRYATRHGYDGVYILTSFGSHVWFDNYKGETTLLIDEFSVEWGISYQALLRLLDGHPTRLPVKGDFTHAGFTKIYITSNVPPTAWFPGRVDLSALLRRLSMTCNFDNPLDRATKLYKDQLDEDLDRELMGSQFVLGRTFDPVIQAGGNTNPPPTSLSLASRAQGFVPNSLLLTISSDDEYEDLEQAIATQETQVSHGMHRLQRAGAFVQLPMPDNSTGPSITSTGDELGDLVGRGRPRLPKRRLFRIADFLDTEAVDATQGYEASESDEDGDLVGFVVPDE